MDFDLDEIAADATLQLLHTGRVVHTAPLVNWICTVCMLDEMKESRFAFV
jgi:hypothetical protein